MKDAVLHVMIVAVLCLASVPAGAQQAPSGLADTPPAGTSIASSLPPKFVIGVGDVLGITFWREQALSGDVVVRPDGKISLPLLNDVQAAGFTPEQLS